MSRRHVDRSFFQCEDQWTSIARDDSALWYIIDIWQACSFVTIVVGQKTIKENDNSNQRSTVDHPGQDHKRAIRPSISFEMSLDDLPETSVEELIEKRQLVSFFLLGASETTNERKKTTQRKKSREQR